MSIRNLLDSNARWAARVDAADPTFFDRLSHQQSPDYLWIGCSDSRVPANQILGVDPGTVFVHRNVGNLAIPSDLNMLAAVQFGVEVLGVRDIIVCGHYGCGAARAALRGKPLGLIDNWLSPLRALAHKHHDDLDALPGEVARVDHLCERNVQEQVRNLAAAPVMQDAWRAGRDVAVHGLIYALADGRLRDLGCSVSGPDQIDPALRLT